MLRAACRKSRDRMCGAQGPSGIAVNQVWGTETVHSAETQSTQPGPARTRQCSDSVPATCVEHLPLRAP